jgi:NADPH-dependent 2,4-dienoyl-CoA reductase/sulfur reductase-like enzyme
VWLLQRKGSKVGEGLAKTTGWIRRTLLKRRGVRMLPGVVYERIDDAGLHVRIDGQPQLIAADTIVVCAGQEPRRELEASVRAPLLIGRAAFPHLRERGGCVVNITLVLLASTAAFRTVRPFGRIVF